MHQRVPVTIVTGFLGAGKTSLVNYLLKERQGKRFAVVENEFGEVDIDRTLVSDNLLEKEDLVSLKNGCVCCSLRKDIVKAFAEIEKRSCQRGAKHDAILLETTGLADPAPVAFTFFANPWMASRFRLDSILCVVDARHLLVHLEHPRPNNAVNEAVQQLAFSDTILLNKIDLVSEAEKLDLLDAIRRINSSATVIECQLNNPARCPQLHELLGVGSFSVNRALEINPTFLDSESESEMEAAEAQAAQAAVACPRPSPTAVAKQAARDVRRRQYLRKVAEQLEQDAMLRSSPSSNSICSDVSSSSAVLHSTLKRPASFEVSPVLGNMPTGFAGNDGNEHSAPRNTPRQSHAAGELCDCCNHPEAVLREGERHPKRPRKKLHDLSGVTSVGVSVEGELDTYRFNMFMRDLLFEKAKDIFRFKGVLCVKGQGTQKFVLQGVHETICYGPADQPWQEEEPRINNIVFIGRGLDRKALIEGFRTCVVSPAQ